MTVTTFRTKVDAWLWPIVAFVFVGPFASLGAGVWALTARRPDAFVFFLTAVLLLGVLAIAWPVTYTLADDELVVRFGLARVRVAYAAITAVAPSRNPLSAPAWSLDRLRIDHDGGFLLISPRDRDAFVAALSSRACRIHRST